jgi:hypothetical protein
VPGADRRLRARLVGRRSRLLLEDLDGALAGEIELTPRDAVAVLRSADGVWTVTEVAAVPQHVAAHWSVRDAAGSTAATVHPHGATALIELPGGDVVWEAPSLARLRFRYRVDGLVELRIPLTQQGRGRPGRRPLKVDEMAALRARPDHSLVLLVAAWLTWSHRSQATA